MKKLLIFAFAFAMISCGNHKKVEKDNITVDSVVVDSIDSIDSVCTD